MTKKELLAKIQEVYEKIDELDDYINDLKKFSKETQRILENIPDEVSEITDDEENDNG